MPATLLAQSTKTFTVNMTGDESDPNANDIGDDGKCDVDPITMGDQCTFRAAIQNHNGNRHLGQNRITFAIPDAPGTGSIVIKVGSTGLGALPPILGSVAINAVNSDSRRIELDGSMAGGGAIGLQLLGGNCEILFFVINSFSSHGMYISGTPPPGAGGHVIQNNYIGTDFTATAAKGNGGDGIFIDNTPGCTIGGTGILRNIISGNEGNGIKIQGDSSQFGTNGAINNFAVGNFIGLDISGDKALPNKKDGVVLNNAPNNTVGGASPGQGNKMAGTTNSNGVTVTGSFTEGIKILGNFIGENNTGAKFKIGIAASAKPITIEGNVITEIVGVGIDLFVNGDGSYNIRKNSFQGNMTVGSKFRFGDGKIVQMKYENNFHTENGLALDVEESASGKIDWIFLGDTLKLGQAGANFIFHAAGNKNFTNGIYQGIAGVAFNYVADLSPGMQMALNVKGDAYTGNAGGARTGKVVLTAGTTFSYALLGSSAVNNGKDGDRLDVIADANATGTFTSMDNEFKVNGGVGLRWINNGRNLITVRAFIEHDVFDKNTEAGIEVKSFLTEKSILNNTVTNNGGPGILLNGTTIAHLEGNTISGNGTGILVNDAATARINNNTVTGNGKGIAFGGTGTGSEITANAIFKNNGLGLDLGNNGPTANDPGDGDAGPNNLQNFPVLTAVNSAGGNTSIQGTLNSKPNTTYKLDFFSNDVCNPSGFGEGQAFLDSFKVTTDAAGNAAFNAVLTGITLPAGAVITSTATDPGHNTSEFSACLLTGNVQTADLELTKTADKTDYAPGADVIYTILLSNKGTANAPDIVVTDVLPAGITFKQAVATVGTYDNATGRWQVPILNSGSQATLTITGTLNAVGTVINTAEVTASKLPDPDSSPNNGIGTEDDQSSVSINVRQGTADLELTKTADKTQYVAGDQIIYVVRLTNKGTTNAPDIVVTDLLPAGITFKQAVVTVGTYNNVTGKWLVPILNVGKQATMAITGTVNTTGAVTNTAEVTASKLPDPDSSPNNGIGTEDDQSSVTVNVQQQGTADLELSKTADKTQYVTGDQVKFIIRLTNKGTANAPGIVVTDILPAGVAFKQAIVTVGAYNNVSGKWQVPILNTGKQATMVIIGTVNAAGTITNTAEVTASKLPDPDSSPNNGVSTEDDQSSVSIQVSQQPDIAQQYKALMQQITALVNAGKLTRAEGQVLNGILDISLQLHNNGQIRPAAVVLRVFIVLIRTATQRTGLTDVDRNALIASAQKIIEQLRALPLRQSSATTDNDSEWKDLEDRARKELMGQPVIRTYPNPFNSYLVISFDVVHESRVQLNAYDVNGRMIALLVDKVMQPGVQTITWRTPHLPAGVYVLQLRANDVVKTYKVLHVRE
ncbi:right-handed parallel beta-helix repeat-containing protein [Chitinophaga filiformis]|uniref:right-handed parallel beta-helix repeat-containing protein n=1 Tax=Chitinophaga filiformis TaxID=104663 RepID=UPI001F2BD665|nr:right-handed parallel beta-helix repeat-containing protein [Chitinophaga filiformis]MCF6405432.1 right-handed parallel beta-helix repeat-containing protein [Chitinophaga filiformis]